jgi:hypothetical protein
MPAHTVPRHASAELRLVTRPSRGGVVLAILAAFALAVLVLNVLPSGAAPRHAPRPLRPPAVKVTVGQRAYACTVVPPAADITGKP